MNYNDIKNYTWYNEKLNNEHEFIRFFYKTDIKIGNEDLFLEVWTNVNNPWMYSLSSTDGEYWELEDKMMMKELPPEGEEKAFRECLKYLFEEGLE